MVLVKTRAKMVVAMIMAMPMGRATRPHSLVLLTHARRRGERWHGVATPATRDPHWLVGQANIQL